MLEVDAAISKRSQCNWQNHSNQRPYSSGYNADAKNPE